MCDNCIKRSFLLAAVSFLLLAGCAASRQHPQPEPSAIVQIASADTMMNVPPEVSERDRTYTIGPFDRIQITVWFNEDLTGEFLIKEDGTITIPGIGNIPLEGLTLLEAQKNLKNNLSKILIQPEVDIEPVLVQSKTYYILGAVTRPGQYPIFQETDVRSALALAGGNTPSGTLNRAYLSRDGQIYMLNIRSMLFQAAEPTWLSKGDILYIPDQQDQRVFVLGYVRSPGPVEVAGAGLDLLAAISAAGGFVPGAQRKEVAVLRLGPDRIYGYIVNIRRILNRNEMNASGLSLQPGDIVYVPATALGSLSDAVSQLSPTFETFVFDPMQAARDYFLIRDIIRRN